MAPQHTAFYLVNEGVYLVKLCPKSSTEYEISGILTNNFEVVVSSLNEIVEIYTPGRVITHYENVNDPTKIMSNEDYSEHLYQLQIKGDWNPDQNELSFKNLEDEFNYKKFIRDWKCVLNQPEQVRQPASIVVTEIRTNTGDPDIKSLWNSYTVENQRKLYLIDRLDLAIKTLQSICSLDGSNLVIPKHSGIRYAKIDDEYIFNGNEVDFVKVNFIGTLEEAKTEKARIVKIINDAYDIHIAKKTKKLSQNGVKDVLDQLYCIRNLIDSRRKSDTLKHINQVINIMENSLLTP